MKNKYLIFSIFFIVDLAIIWNGAKSQIVHISFSVIQAAPLSITIGKDTSVCEGTSLIINPKINGGTLPYNYLWKLGSSLIRGATQSSYSVELSGKYTVVISDALSCSNTSTAVTINVDTPPSIKESPLSQAACEGSNITFSLQASGTNLKYQWTKISGAIAGATTSTYSIINLKPADGNIYSCSVSNGCESKTMKPFLLSISQKPVISISPLIQIKDPGNSLQYILSPTGTAPFAYQWLKDNSILEGKTLNPFEINPISCTDAGVYSVIISNSCGSTSSLAGTLVVNCGVHKLSGYVIYDDILQKAMTNTIVYLENSNAERVASVQTDDSGFYEFKNVSGDVYKLICETTYKWGGANSTDALLISKYFVKLYTFGDDLKKAAADVNLDGKINSTDALYINKRFVAIINKFPAADWIFETPYILVGNSDVEQDIRAICTGDVNGSY